MLFHFSEYQFDSEQKLLTRNGSIVPLKDKPAEMLLMFLSETNAVHSKNDILNKVWSGKVVTDQVVFQNINTLRGLFGNDAIKTFSKKGYQWQLTVNIDKKEESAHSVRENSDVTKSFAELVNRSLDEVSRGQVLSGHGHSRRQILISVSSIACIFILILALVYYNVPTNHNSENPLILISNPSFDFEEATSALIDKSKVIEDSRTHQRLFDSPFATWRELANKHERLLAIKTYDIASGTILRFHIQGAKRGWQGYIFNSTQDENIAKLNWLVSSLTGSDFFEVESDYSALATLTTLHTAYPNELLLVHQIVQLNYRLGSLDRAIALTEEQITAQKESFHLGLFHQLNAQLSTWNQNWQRGRESNDAALEIFKSLQIPHLAAKAFIQDAWIKYYFQNGQDSMQSLNQAIKKARVAKEPLQEVNAVLIQASLAIKLGQKQMMDNQIDLAKQLIDMHHLHQEHLVAVSYYKAWGEEEPQEKLAIYESMLTMPYSEVYSNFLHGAAEALRDNYIRSGAPQKAAMSIKPWQRLSFQALSRAHVAYAEDDTHLAITEAIEAFRHAQIAVSTEDALDAALLLTTYQKSNVKVKNSDTYINYIRQNASHRWLQQNNSALRELAILKHVIPL